MRILIRDKEGNLHWSPEMYLQVYMLLIFIYASQLITYRLCRILDKQKDIEQNFVQQNKRYLNMALKNAEGLSHNLEIAYDATFDITSNGKHSRYDILRAAANDLIILFGLYQSRKEARLDRFHKTGEQIKNYIRSIKGPETYDVEDTLKYYSNND